MRGQFQDQGGMFSCIHPEKRITAKHPLRRIHKLVREVLFGIQVRLSQRHQWAKSIPQAAILSCE